MRTAVIFVHGILGNCEFFDFMLPCVDACDIFKVELAGHGGMPQDFGRTSMQEWRRQVHDIVAELRPRYERRIIVAHSMGTLFAIQEAVDRNVNAIFLLNLPLRLRLTCRLFSSPIKVFFNKISADDEWALAAKRAYGIDADSNILHYAGWLPRYLELFAEIRRVRKIIHQIKIPVTAFFSHHDEMVSPRSAEIMLRCKTATLSGLPDSGHYYYSPTDRQEIQATLKDCLRQITSA